MKEHADQPTHVFVRSTIRDDYGITQKCKCSPIKWSNVDNTHVSEALRRLYPTGKVSDCLIEGVGVGVGGKLWSFGAYMDCELLEMTNTSPTLFLLSDKKTGQVEKFVFRAASRAGREEAASEGGEENDSKGGMTIGSALSSCGRVMKGWGIPGFSPARSASPEPVLTPAEQPHADTSETVVPQPKHYFLGTLVDETNVQASLRQLIGGILVKRTDDGLVHTGNHITVVNPLRFFSDWKGMKEADAEENCRMSIRAQVKDEWRYNHERWPSEEEEQSIDEYVGSHLHFMSTKQWEDSDEGKLAAWQLKKRDEAQS